ncbi:hypothetical protein G6M14_25740 [Agrobacterium tumefaciens]|nr:hypothetical protein [Agrobacterium tumefaciens]
MIPYSKRAWKDGAFHFIQPFADAQGDLTQIDLYLDNNAFIELTLNDGLLDGVKNIAGVQGYTLNPSIALAEQWISNPVFREQAKAGPGKHEMIERFMAIAARRGQIFAPNYIDTMIGMCQQREAELRLMLGCLFAYVAALRSLQRRKMPFDDRITRFQSVLTGDVPVFTGLIGLAAFTFYALANRTRADESGAQLVTSIDGFFAPKGDEPVALSQGYLRNRAMDLLTWYMMPRFLNAEINRNAPTPLVVTADRFLAAVPFRYLPPLRVQGPTPAIALAVVADGLDVKDQNGFLDTFRRLNPPARQGRFPIERKLVMLKNLNSAVSAILSTEDRAGFEDGLHWAARPAPDRI